MVICNVINIVEPRNKQELVLRAKVVCFLYSESQLYGDNWMFLCEALRGLFWVGLVLIQDIDQDSKLPQFSAHWAIGNQFIRSKLNDVYRKLTLVAGTDARRKHVDKVFRLLLNEMNRANKGNVEGMYEAAVVERRILKCDAMLIGLRYSQCEERWYT
jgi:hypothetical protein